MLPHQDRTGVEASFCTLPPGGRSQVGKIGRRLYWSCPYVKALGLTMFFLYPWAITLVMNFVVNRLPRFTQFLRMHLYILPGYFLKAQVFARHPRSAGIC